MASYACRPEECGLYISTYKAFEHKSPDTIKERIDKDYASILRAALTSIRSVNKTDVTTLKTTFGVSQPWSINCGLTYLQSFSNLSRATTEQIVKCPGLGETKARRIKDAFEKPFRLRPAQSHDEMDKSGNQPQQSNIQRPFEVPAPLNPRKRIQESPDEDPPPSKQARPLRTPSPAWSIELDLNE